MRKTIFDKTTNLKIDCHKEILRILGLFSISLQIGTYNQFGGRMSPGFTIEQCVNELAFKKWKHRGRFLSIDEMKAELRITNTYLNDKVDLDTMLLYFEFVINMIILAEKHFDEHRLYYLDETFLKVIFENIISVLDQVNYAIRKEDDEKYVIVAKNPATDAVAEICKDLSDKVIEYNKVSLKGDIDRKREILLALGDKFEPLRRKLEQGGFSDLEKKCGLLLNSINIRHNNREGAYRNEFAANVKPAELEVWYDRTYDALLLALLTANYIDTKKEIDDLIQEIKQKPTT